MAATKTTKWVYWSTTTVIFLFEGVVPALTSHTQLAVEGIRHLGYPDYFRVWLTVLKVAGATALVLPFIKGRIKEWAYAGFAFTMLSAGVSHFAVDGFGAQTVFPLFMLVILFVSYQYYHKLTRRSETAMPVQSQPYTMAGVVH